MNLLTYISHSFVFETFIQSMDFNYDLISRYQVPEKDKR